MSKTYYVTFGTSGDPRTFFGLAPTFLIFNNAGSAVTPPSISAVTGATGFYSFSWGTTTPIAFMIDAATTSPGTAGRYVIGSIDPNDRGDEYGTSLIALGTTSVAIGTTLIGYGTSCLALGTTSVAIGTTLVGYGVSGLALGTTSVAIGTTLTGYGVSLLAQGTTNVAIGTTLTGYGVSLMAFGASNIALGTTNVAIGTTLTGYGVSLMAFGASNIALGTSILYVATNNGTSLIALAGAIGSTASSFGSTSIDPGTVFGYLKRAQEVMEGNNVYTKATGVMQFLSRGSSTLLANKTISDTSTQTTKT